MLGLAASLGTVGFHRLQRPLPSPKQSIENAALSDQPATNLKQDLLNVADIVRALAEFLRNRNTEPPVTLSVEGRWGIGKISAMRMLQSELRHAHVPTVWFNAWHNEGEEQMLAFLLESIRQDAFPRWWDPREIPFRLRLLVVRFERWPVILLLLAAAALFILHPVLDWLRHVDTEDVKNLGNIVERLRDLNWAELVAIATALGAAYPLVRKVLRLATGISAQPSDLLSDADSKSGNAARTSFRTRFARELREAIQAFGPERRITIFIDDLDRCQPEQVRQTLEAVNFLISSAGCFVVMGIARDIVEASVGLGFKEIADELVESGDPAVDTQEDKEQAAKGRRRGFARNYLLKLINLTVMLRPYSGEALANVATSTAKTSDGPSFLRQTGPYALIAATVLASVLLWSVPKIPHVDPEDRVLPEESYKLPGALESRQLKSLVVERDADERVVGEKRTYEIGEKASEQTPSTPSVTTQSGGTPARPLGVEPSKSSQGVSFEAGQTYNPSRWLWWMVPLLLGAAGFTTRAFLFPRQRPIQDSPEFRQALRLWRVVYENEIRTPREIKRFVNELRYKSIRFRGPQGTVSVLGKTEKGASTGSSLREPALILLAILDRLNKGSGDPRNARQWLPQAYESTFAEHVKLFGEPESDDWDRYRTLFGGK
jgi:KAP family P-loop domain